jgi:HK97 family phage portal protein
MNQTSLFGEEPLHHLEKRGTWSGPLTSSSPELARLWAAPAVSTGISVSETTAFMHSVFWACVNNISTDVGTLPLNLYKREEDGGKSILRRHKLHQLLHFSPNREMTAASFRGTLTSHALTWGAGYAEVLRDGAGAVRELWPITPDRVTVQRYDYTGELYYAVTRQDGSIDKLGPYQMFVLPGSSYDGVCGYNIVSLARESIGLGLAAEKFGGTFFGNGTTFGGVFEHPGRMSEQAQKNFRESVNGRHQGVERSHRFFVAEEGMKFQKLSVDPNAAQFLETRQFQIEEVCRWFRMPPHKVQHLIRTSYNSAEQMALEYTMDTLAPWCVRWEQEIWRQLIAPSERLIQFVKHNMDAKQRGDFTSRHSAYAQGIQHGYFSPNDVREYEDLNPIPGGDVYAFPVNMVPSDRINEIVDKQVAPDPPPVAPPPAQEPKNDDEADRHRVIIEEIRQQLTAVHASMASMTQALADARDGEVATLRAALAAKQAEEAELTVQLGLAQERAAEQRAAREVAEALAAEQDAARVEALAVSETLRRQVEAAHAEAAAEQAVKARLQAEAEAAATTRTALESQAADFRAQVEAAQATLAETRESAVTERQQAEAELARLQDALQVAEARAQQAATDAAALAAAVAAADETIATLKQDIATADAVRSETSRALGEVSEARVMAQTELADLRLTLASLLAERDLIVAERDSAQADAKTAAERAEAAHQATLQATAQIAQATADAAAASQLLAEETARRAAEQASHEETRTLVTTKQQTTAQWAQGLIASHRNLVLRTMGMLVNKEIERAKRNQGTPAKLLAWAEGYYLLLEETCIDALRPVMQTHLAFVGSTSDVDTFTRGVLRPQLETALEQIRAVAKGDPEEFPMALEKLLTRWERERPAALADLILQEEVSYVRSL